MLFDPRRYLEPIDRDQLNHGMRRPEGGDGATRATRANRGVRNSPDPSALLALLRDRGPLSYGAAASALGWGATRAWRAEAGLKAAGHIEHDRIGRAAVKARAGA